MLQKFRVRLKGFRFTAFVPPGQKIGADDPVPVEWLKRQTTPKFDADGKDRGPKARVAIGRQEHRDWLLVEAHSEEEAQGLFVKACGIKNTSGDFKVHLVEEPEAEPVGAGAAAAEAKPARRGKKSADDLARDMLGGGPAEE